MPITKTPTIFRKQQLQRPGAFMEVSVISRWPSTSIYGSKHALSVAEHLHLWKQRYNDRTNIAQRACAFMEAIWYRWWVAGVACRGRALP